MQVIVVLLAEKILLYRKQWLLMATWKSINPHDNLSNLDDSIKKNAIPLLRNGIAPKQVFSG